MFAVAWTRVLWLVAAAWLIFCVVFLTHQVVREARRMRAQDRMTKMLTGQLQAAQAAGDELAAYRYQRALDERSARHRHPTAWGQP